MERKSSSLVAVAAASLCVVAESQASFAWFNNDFAGWEAAASAYNTCSFTEFPHNTWITDQYAGQGVLFTNPGPNVVHAGDFQNFPLDGHGIDGNGGIELTFLQPTYAAGAHGPDYWTFKAYLGDLLVYTSPAHLPSQGTFAGFVSTTPFDRVQLLGLPPGGSIDDVYIDNIYFSTVPAPSAVALIVLGMSASKRRRR